MNNRLRFSVDPKGNRNLGNQTEFFENRLENDRLRKNRFNERGSVVDRFKWLRITGCSVQSLITDAMCGKASPGEFFSHKIILTKVRAHVDYTFGEYNTAHLFHRTHCDVLSNHKDRSPPSKSLVLERTREDGSLMAEVLEDHRATRRGVHHCA